MSGAVTDVFAAITTMRSGAPAMPVTGVTLPP